MGEEQRLKDAAPTPLRYAVLHHTGIANPHFDLLIETSPGSPLASWRSAMWPVTQPTTLLRLNDHRQLYLDFEGRLTNNRGSVKRIETGICQIDIVTNDRWNLQLCGHRLTLTHLISENWLCEPAEPGDPDDAQGIK
jgi:hypothetical protein